ncbi:MAG: hypothetical protein WCL14_05440 [Bacteroidota bacterium]
MALETLADYHCTEVQLYGISKAIYNSLAGNLVDFHSYSPSYIIGHVTGLLGVRTAAMVLPNEVQRAEGHEILHTELIAAAKPCTEHFQILKGYIKKAYPSTYNIMYNSAGQGHYLAATHENWVELKGLNDAMNTFLADVVHLAALVASLNMPPAFPATVSTDATSFENLYNAFITAKTTTTAKNAKIAANNVLFGQLMGVCDDGKKVYINDQGQAKLFTFDTVKELLSPPGSASYKVTAKRAELLTVIEGIIVKIQSKTKPAISVETDVNGVALFPHLDADNYTVIVGGVSTPFVVQSFKKDVDTGVNAHSEVFMVSI